MCLPAFIDVNQAIAFVFGQELTSFSLAPLSQFLSDALRSLVKKPGDAGQLPGGPDTALATGGQDAAEEVCHVCSQGFCFEVVVFSPPPPPRPLVMGVLACVRLCV